MSLQCMVCKGKNITEVVQENRRYFLCDSCDKLYERAYDSTYGRDIAINTGKGIYHVVSSGCIVNDQNQFLLIKRRSYPFGYTFPGGHVEYAEKPLDALKREIFEETGLRVRTSELIFEGEIAITKCRYGADSHVWYFYKCNCEPGNLVLNPESEISAWYTHEEALSLDLTPSARYLLEHNIV